MRIIIVEDEDPAKELLKSYLSTVGDIEVIGVYSDGFTAAVAINKDKPDVVLLDIQLPRLNGFEVLEVLDHTPQIIFTTAYDEYAIKAFDQNATDYLLKPFSRDRFNLALQKAREKMTLNLNEKNTSELAEELTSSIQLNRIVVKDTKGIHVIATNDIHYIEAQDDYIMIYTQHGRFMKKQTMKSIEGRLNPAQFIRSHRSYIINILDISRIEPYEKDSYIAILKNDSRVKVSQAGYKAIKQQLDF
jgi:two-component system, LytTR family, response regulator